MATAAQIIARMRGWRGALIYQQVLGVWNNSIGNVLRPDPDETGYADCTSTIQHAFLKSGGPDPGYYTQDMRRRGTRVASSNDGNYSAIRAGDVLLMQWRNGLWHAELAVDNTTCIGHPGPGQGPTEKNLRSYLGGAAYWEARRHPLETTTPSPKPISPATVAGNDDEEENMKGCFYKKDGGKTVVYMLFDQTSGFISKFSNGTKAGPMAADYVNGLARNWGTGSWPGITEGHAAAIERDLAKVREGKR